MSSTSSNAAAAAAQQVPGDDWRKTITQSYRNKQVRHIAQVLSSIDPGTTVASKLKLAYQFEDQNFKASPSLEEYHKRMNKRLAKLQKKWAASSAATAATADGTSASGGGSSGNTADEKKSSKFQELHSKLVKEYGPALIYIYKKAPEAIAELQDGGVVNQQPNAEKAAQLKKHTDDAQRWGEQLGIFTSSSTATSTPTPAVTAAPVPSPSSSDGNSDDNVIEKDKDTNIPSKVEIHTNLNDTSSLNPTIQTYDQLLQLEQYLQKRVSNVKQYVMRFGDVDAWTHNNLVERDQQYRSTSSDVPPGTPLSSSSSFQQKAAYHLSKRLESITSKHHGHQSISGGENSGAATTSAEGSGTVDPTRETDPRQMQKRAQEKARKRFLESYNGTILQRIPPPTRDNKRETEIGLAHVAKMRAAANALEHYFQVPNRHDDGVLLPSSSSSLSAKKPAGTGGSGGNASMPGVTSKDEGNIILTKLHTTAMEGMDYCVRVLKERQQQSKQETAGGDDDDGDGVTEANPEDAVELQDAWTKSLLEVHQDGVDDEGIAKLDSIADDEDPATMSRAKKKLKTSHDGSNDATHDRTAVSKPAYIKAKMLLQNPNKPATNQLLTALARKRARLYQRLSTPATTTTTTTETSDTQMMATHLVLDFGTAFQMTIWFSPLMVQIRAIPPSLSDGENENPHTVSSSSPSAWKSLSYGLVGYSPARPLSAWGVNGDYSTLGRVVEERLRDASTQATYALRRSFAKHVKDKIIPIEVEILETSALMDFLHLVRRTYIPGWQDIDD